MVRSSTSWKVLNWPSNPCRNYETKMLEKAPELIEAEINDYQDREIWRKLGGSKNRLGGFKHVKYVGKQTWIWKIKHFEAFGPMMFLWKLLIFKFSMFDDQKICDSEHIRWSSGTPSCDFPAARKWKRRASWPNGPALLVCWVKKHKCFAITKEGLRIHINIY